MSMLNFPNTFLHFHEIFRLPVPQPLNFPRQIIRIPALLRENFNRAIRVS